MNLWTNFIKLEKQLEKHKDRIVRECDFITYPTLAMIGKDIVFLTSYWRNHVDNPILFNYMIFSVLGRTINEQELSNICHFAYLHKLAEVNHAIAKDAGDCLCKIHTFDYKKMQMVITLHPDAVGKAVIVDSTFDLPVSMKKIMEQVIDSIGDIK
jgi:hypothetical protein